MIFRLPLTRLAVLTLLAVSTFQNSAQAQVFGCIGRPGDNCVPERPGRGDHYQPGRPDHQQPERPGRPDHGGDYFPPARPGQGGGFNPGRPHPQRPNPTIELRRSFNHAVYQTDLWNLNQLFNLRNYQGYRLLEVEVIARPLRGRSGYLELYTNRHQESGLAVTSRWPSSHRLWFNSYQVIGHQLRRLALGLTEVEVKEVIIRIVRD